MFQHTWHFLLFALAGFINRQQQDIIEYYREKTAFSARSSATNA